jgi:hypothetical protein
MGSLAALVPGFAEGESSEELRSRADDAEGRLDSHDCCGATPMRRMMALLVIRYNRKRLHGERYSPHFRISAGVKSWISLAIFPSAFVFAVVNVL